MRRVVQRALVWEKYKLLKGNREPDWL